MNVGPDPTPASETTETDCGWKHRITKTYTVPLPTVTTNEVGDVTTRTYDSKSRLTGVRLPAGLTVTNRYDSAGFLTNNGDR